MKTVEKNLLNWHVRRDGMRWEELRWGEKSSHDLRDEVSSAKCKCEVWRVQCEVWRKCLLGVALRRGRAQVMFLDNICATASHKATNKSVKCWSVKSAVRSAKCEVELQMWHVKQDTTFAECTHARAWLAHGACKFYRWERSYISLRQLPPRLVRVLLVYIYIYQIL